MEDICRTCLRSPETLFSLNDDIGLIYKIETVSSVQLSGNDKFPSRICGECITNVNKLFNFRKVIINSDKEIRERYAALQRSDYNKPKIKTDEMQGDDSVTVDDCIKSELQQDNESVGDNALDNTEPMASNIERDLGESKESAPNPVNAIKRAVSMKKTNKCSVCDKVFTTSTKLYNHKQFAHNTRTSVICTKCGLLVRTYNLSKHMLIHTEGPVECKHCGKVFKNTGSMRSHLLIHRGLTYTCETCGKTSQSKPMHTAHLKTHKDKELYKVMCKICGKKFTHLRMHMLTHTGERRHFCSYCNKGFTTPYGMRVHTRQHTNERPYVCEYCPKAFAEKVSLKTHIKLKHTVEVTGCTETDN